MTAETLKPFISLPSTTNGFTTPKRNIHVFIIIGLLSTIVLVASLSGFVVWKSSSRVNDLEKKVYSLQRVMGIMQERLGLNYLDEFDDLKEFEKAYSNNGRIDDPNTSEEMDGDLLVDSYGDVEDYEDDDDLDNSDDVDLNLDGSGNYSDDEDDDDDDDDDDDGGDRKLYDDLKKFHESKKLRKSRSISSNGFPIYHESFTMRKNKTEELGLDDHILNKGYSSTMRPKEVIIDPPNQYKDGRNHHSNKMVHGDVKSRNHMRRREWNRKYNVLRPALPVNTGSPYYRSKPQALTVLPSIKTAAVHYYINSTISGAHSFHDGNHLHHHGDIYIGYPHKWALEQNSDIFDVNHGIVKIREDGIYFIYAQIFYDNHFDQNGYKIFHNNEQFLQCALTVPTHAMKSNTCYTSGVIFLNRDDTIHLRDVFRQREVLYSRGKSFFGLIKLGSSN